MWILSTLDSFRRLASWVSTILIFAALGNLTMAALFKDYRLWNIVMAGSVFLLAIVAKRALWTFETDPRCTIETIEKCFYVLFGIYVVSGIYVAGNERAPLGLPSLMLISLNVAVAIFVFRLGQKNISFAKSLTTERPRP